MKLKSSSLYQSHWASIFQSACDWFLQRLLKPKNGSTASVREYWCPCWSDSNRRNSWSKASGMLTFVDSLNNTKFVMYIRSRTCCVGAFRNRVFNADPLSDKVAPKARADFLRWLTIACIGDSEKVFRTKRLCNGGNFELESDSNSPTSFLAWLNTSNGTALQPTTDHSDSAGWFDDDIGQMRLWNRVGFLSTLD